MPPSPFDIPTGNWGAAQPPPGENISLRKARVHSRTAFYRKLVFKLLVSGGLIVFLVDKLDTPAIRNGLLNVNPQLFLGSLIVLALLVALQGLRWLLIARALKLPVSIPTAIRVSFIGAFFSQVLPSAVGGDAIRVYWLYRSGLSLGTALNSILIDRIVAVSGLLLLALGGFSMLGWATLPLNLSAALALVAAVGTGGLTALLCLDRLPLPHWIAKLRFIQTFTRLSGDARRVCFRPGIFLIAMLASLAAHATVSAVFWFLGRDAGLGASFAACIAMVPVATLLTTLPVSVAGWGVREGALVLALSAVGGDAAAVLVTSILLGLATACSSLPGALFWLGSVRRRHASGPEAVRIEEDVEIR
jgi:uncharacterized membrane protein YbhN (UPF0104 family)